MDSKPIIQSKTIWFGIIVPFLYPLTIRGVQWLAAHLAISFDDAAVQQIAQQIVAALPVAAGVIYLRLVTRQPVK